MDYNVKRDFIIMVGISGSGKSYTARNIANMICNSCPKYDSLGRADICDIISSDAIRGELLGDESDQSQNDMVFKEVHKRIRESLLAYHHVIVDATNIKIKNRKSILDCLKVLTPQKKQHYIIGADIVATSIEESKKRNAARDRVVPEFVIDRQVASFEIPFYEEGFDFITVEGYNPFKSNKISDGEVIKWVREKMGGFNQNTHHHKYTLDEHCIKVYNALKDRTNDETLLRAGLVHDYGKLFTGRLKDDNSGESCYYSHHNVGAYKLLGALEEIGMGSMDKNLKFLFYVNYHMQPFFLNSDKSKEKWKRIWGEDNYNALTLFNECDIIGSGR